MEMRSKGRVADIKLYLLETAMVFISFFGGGWCGGQKSLL